MSDEHRIGNAMDRLPVVTGVLLLHIRAHLSTANPFDTPFQTFIKHVLCGCIEPKA